MLSFFCDVPALTLKEDTDDQSSGTVGLYNSMSFRTQSFLWVLLASSMNRLAGTSLLLQLDGFLWGRDLIPDSLYYSLGDCFLYSIFGDSLTRCPESALAEVFERMALL